MSNHMVTQQTSLDSVFSALADPTRRRIVERLVRRQFTVNEIASGFAMSRPAVSKHLRVLEECGILTREVVGREHRCAIDPKAMRTAATWLERQERYWNSVLDNLDRHLRRDT